MSTRLRVTMTFAVVTQDGGVIREQSYGAIVPAATPEHAESLSGIVANTIKDELPVFLAAK